MTRTLEKPACVSTCTTSFMAGLQHTLSIRTFLCTSLANLMVIVLEYTSNFIVQKRFIVASHNNGSIGVSFGEQYAGGHYVPATTSRIGKSLPIAGMGVGNGLTDPLVQYKFYGQLAYNWSIEVQGKPTISLQQYERIQASIPSCISMIKECQTNTNACANAEFICNNDMLSAYETTGQSNFISLIIFNI